MSYTIDYRQKAYFVNDDKYGDKDYLVLHEIGSNNCTEINSRKRARDWEIMGFGWAYSIWHKIAQWVGNTAGHCLEIKGLKHSGDDYNNPVDCYLDMTQKGLKKYANLIKRAKPLEKIFDDFHQISIYISLEDAKNGKKKLMQLEDIKDKYYKESLQKYLTTHKLKLKESKDFYGYKQSTVRMEIKTTKELLDAIIMKKYDGGVQFSIMFNERYGLSMD